MLCGYVKHAGRAVWATDLQQVLSWDRDFGHRKNMDIGVLCFFQVVYGAAYARGWSLFRRIPTECVCVQLCVI
jgi:hypothetical protein